jgi:glutamine synthetase
MVPLDAEVGVVNNQESKEYVLQAAKEQDVKFIRAWFTDILGNLKSVAITVEELETALEEGVTSRLFHRGFRPHRRERYDCYA